MTQHLVPRANPGTIGLMGHVIADYPNRSAALDVVQAMINSGVALIEIQIPFSEPIADGPVLMAANHLALNSGVNLARAFEFAKLVSARTTAPVVFMTYVNVPWKYGWQRFVDESTSSGVRGAIVPDLPFEHSSEFDSVCDTARFANIRVVAPNTSDARLARIADVARGMIYATARAGVTGSKTTISGDLSRYVARIRTVSELPVAVGFGISSPDDVRALKGVADLAVVGSQTFRALASGGVPAVAALWQSLARA